MYFFLLLWEIGLTLPREGRAVSCAEEVMGSWHLHPKPQRTQEIWFLQSLLKYMLKITL